MEANASTVYNEATATGTPPSGPNVTVWDDLSIPIVQHPAIDIVKTPDIQKVALGGTATFNISVTNIGDVTLTSVTDASGWCEVSLTKLDLGLTSITFSVMDIAADGYLYDPDFNVDSEETAYQ